MVCPSLPGYGFGGKPAAPGWGIEKIAAEWDCGYSKEHATRPQTAGYGLVDSPAGGHFAAFEQPAQFVAGARSFFRLVR